MVSHPEVTSPQAWREALQSATSKDGHGVPAKYTLLNTLVFKPKTAKTATPVPVIVFAAEESDTGATALGKKLNLKELRLANEELLKEFFGCDKDSCMSSINW